MFVLLLHDQVSCSSELAHKTIITDIDLNVKTKDSRSTHLNGTFGDSSHQTNNLFALNFALSRNENLSSGKDDQSKFIFLVVNRVLITSVLNMYLNY